MVISSRIATTNGEQLKIYINKMITKEEYLKRIKIPGMEYWQKSYEKRWLYMEAVIKELEKIQPKTAIEVGTAGIPLMSFSDEVDKNAIFFDGNKNTKKYLFDLSKTPWTEIADKQYDVFVALQVIEHLDNVESVFDEIRRISKYSIITLPYMWQCKDENNCHHMIDYATISKWTGGQSPISLDLIVSGINDNYANIMLVYKND
jgi:hypothetical protein